MLTREQIEDMRKDLLKMKEELDGMNGSIPTYEEVGKVFLMRRNDVIQLALDGLSHFETKHLAKDVHTEHCCKNCGCKYGEPYCCPVVNGDLIQSYKCGELDICCCDW